MVDPRTLGEINMKTARVFLVYLVLFAVNQSHAAKPQIFNFSDASMVGKKGKFSIQSDGQTTKVTAAGSTFKISDLFPAHKLNWDYVTMGKADEPISRSNSLSQTTTIYVVQGHITVKVGTFANRLKAGYCLPITPGKDFTIETPQKDVRMFVKRVMAAEK
jgi:hypothetical protein